LAFELLTEGFPLSERLSLVRVLRAGLTSERVLRKLKPWAFEDKKR
jgi:hypothetical protein